MNLTIDLKLASATALAATGMMMMYVRYSKSRWERQLTEFSVKHHGRKSSSTSDQSSDVLMVVNPASGAGRAMGLFQECLCELEKKKFHVEVYVTQSSDDLITLSDTKDLSAYPKMIVFVAGDSSIYEFVQAALRENDGKWPYAPILHIPGGSSNVLSAEFHHRSQDVADIVQNATLIRKGSVLKVTADGVTTRFSLQVCFTGLFVRIIETLERRRADLYAALGAAVVPFLALSVVILFPFQPMTPPLFFCGNSDVEAEGMDLGYGVNRFTNSMSVVHVKKYKGLFNLCGHLARQMKGEYGKECQEGKVFRDDVDVQVTQRYTLSGGHFRLFSDGTSSLPIEGSTVTIEVIPDAIPYYVIPEKIKK